MAGNKDNDPFITDLSLEDSEYNYFKHNIIICKEGVQKQIKSTINFCLLYNLFIP